MMRKYSTPPTMSNRVFLARKMCMLERASRWDCRGGGYTAAQPNETQLAAALAPAAALAALEDAAAEAEAAVVSFEAPEPGRMALHCDGHCAVVALEEAQAQAPLGRACE